MSERVKEIRERADRASPGPWLDEPASEEWKANGPANYDFCRHAREDIPFLLAELERLAKERDELKAKYQPQIAERVQSALAVMMAERDTPEAKLRFWDDVLAERDRLAEALEVAKKSLKWVSDEGYKVVPSHWREIAREQALDANRALREIERISRSG